MRRLIELRFDDDGEVRPSSVVEEILAELEGNTYLRSLQLRFSYVEHGEKVGTFPLGTYGPNRFDPEV